MCETVETKALLKKTKIKLCGAFVTPVLMYGSEYWCVRKEDERRILVAEMSWLRRIAGKTRRYRIRNEFNRKELGQTATPDGGISKRRLTWFGHVVRLPVKALYCYADGKRSRGRRTKTWMDNVRQYLAEKDMELRTALDILEKHHRR